MAVQSTEEVRDILGMRRIAVVGASAIPGKDAHHVPEYLLEQGYDLIPVNPNRETVHGLEAYDSLLDVEGPIDIVNVFRPSDEVAGIVDQAIDRGDVGVIWLQLGIHDDAAVDRAEETGITVVQDRCIRTAHRMLLG